MNLVLKDLVVVDIDRHPRPGYFIGFYDGKYYRFTFEGKPYEVGEKMDFNIVVSHLQRNFYEISIDNLRPWVYEVSPTWEDTGNGKELWRFPGRKTLV